MLKASYDTTDFEFENTLSASRLNRKKMSRRIERKASEAKKNSGAESARACCGTSCKKDCVIF